MAFNDAGYDVRLPWHVLDAAHYGVPQHRQRLILLGARKGKPFRIIQFLAPIPPTFLNIFQAYRSGQRAEKQLAIFPTRINSRL